MGLTEVDDADIIAVDKHSPSEGFVKLLEELVQPTRLSHPISDVSILNLSTGAETMG